MFLTCHYISDFDDGDEKDDEVETFKDTESDSDKKINESEKEKEIIKSGSESDESDYGEETDDDNDVEDEPTTSQAK